MINVHSIVTSCSLCSYAMALFENALPGCLIQNYSRSLYTYQWVHIS